MFCVCSGRVDVPSYSNILVFLSETNPPNDTNLCSSGSTFTITHRHILRV